MKAARDLRERFLENYIVNESTDCWEWIGDKARKGYGRIFIGPGSKKPQELAHRVSYRLFRGEIPPGLFICHHCDNPSCVNPSHLFMGTNGDNMKNAAQKGRVRNGGLRGSRLTQSKLNEQIVSEILKSSESHVSLGRKFGVDISTIWKVRNQRTWNHVKVEEEGYPNR